MRILKVAESRFHPNRGRRAAASEIVRRYLSEAATIVHDLSLLDRLRRTRYRVTTGGEE